MTDTVRVKLTNRFVEQFPKADEKRDSAVAWDTEVKGLGLRWSRNKDIKTFFLQFRVRGSKTQIQKSLGRFDDPMRVEQARAKALELKVQMIDGVDPYAEQRRKADEAKQQAAIEKARATTLREVLEHFLEHHGTAHGALRAKTRQDYRRHCEKNLTSWLDDPVRDITRDRCLAKFAELKKRAPHQARSCMIYLRALLNHARDMHATDDGEFTILATNPVTRAFKIMKPEMPAERDRVIPLKKVGAVWNWLRSQSANARTENERVASDWVTTMLLTGMRRTESGSLLKADIDLEARTLTVRPEVAKNHRKHVLPLSDELYAVLATRIDPPAIADKVARRRAVERSAAYVFPTNGRKRQHIDNAQAALREVSTIAGVTISAHDVRRTFESIAAEVGIDGDQRRLLLNHRSGDVHARHYGSHRERLVSSVQKVATWISAQGRVAEAMASGANVVAFRK